MIEQPVPAAAMSDRPYIPLRLEVVARDDLAKFPHWQRAFAGERKDHRYYELIEDTLHPEFDYRYFILRDASGEVRAVEPFFMLDQDLLVGISGRLALEMSVVNDVTPFIHEIYPLYLQAYERSKLHFEKLTEQYFRELGRRMRDKVRFF